MTCEHLKPLEDAILAAAIRETYRGQAWSQNCREWVYFDCYINTTAVRDQFSLPECIKDHTHQGTHDGQERGLVCTKCHDGVMGRYEKTSGVGVFPK